MENQRQGGQIGGGNRNHGGGGGRNYGYNNNYRCRGFEGGGYRGRGGYNNGGSGRITDLTKAELRARLEKIQMQKDQEERSLAAMAKDKQVGGSSSSIEKLSAGDTAGKGKELISKGESFTCGKTGHVEASCPSKLEQLGLHLCAYGILWQRIIR
jgi:hypothetical protein